MFLQVLNIYVFIHLQLVQMIQMEPFPQQLDPDSIVLMPRLATNFHYVPTIGLNTPVGKSANYVLQVRLA